MNLDLFECSPRQLVARWLLIPESARYRCHYGLFLYSDGTVSFYDIFSHRLIHHDDRSDLWMYDFWIREFYDELCAGEEAERICLFSRKVVLKRTLVEWILRANRKHRYSVEDIQEGDVLSRVINGNLERLFWTEIASFLTYIPLQRKNAADPYEAFPTRPGEAVLNVPVDIPQSRLDK